MIDYTPWQTFWHKSFYKLNDLYAKALHPKDNFVAPALTPEESSALVYEALASGKPCMIARYGATELYCLSNYLGIQQGWRNAPGFIRGTAEPWWWAPERIENMRDCSGFFPLEEEAIARFCEMMLEDTEQLDILASWLSKERHLDGLLAGKPKILLPYLEPWFAESPWTRVLEGKRVVVVHPFSEQIEYQYHHCRKSLFGKENILPPFSLRTVKAVQSLGGHNDQGFTFWFEALDWMKDQIGQTDFDICLLGCGAYGFSLAASVKRMGKQAVHLGGALQLLFGIKGKRWEDPQYGVQRWGLPEGFYVNMFNDHWKKPDDFTKPANAQQVEGACYW